MHIEHVCGVCQTARVFCRLGGQPQGGQGVQAHLETVEAAAAWSPPWSWTPSNQKRGPPTFRGHPVDVRKHVLTSSADTRGASCSRRAKTVDVGESEEGQWTDGRHQGPERQRGVQRAHV